jgi:arabinoxylan arabinofuranohydrolase
MTHTFGADPNVLVYNERVYIYMTGDTLEIDGNGEVKNNTYSNINTIRVVSSADLVNWVYHEPIKVAGSDGIAKWAARSWAPAIVYRKMNEQDRFFLYFSNNANGVGVLTADSPLGPWTDPLGKALISRQTPNCSDVPWVFDPAVFIDDDGKAYIYFGGGVPTGKEADPGSARAAKLNSDMISLASDPVKIDVPYFFEAIEMSKLNGRYIFSYCTNWNVTNEAKAQLKIDNAVIAVMSGSDPLGPFKLEGTILRNPGTFFGVWGNNHHDIFEFKGQWYIAYHSQILEAAMGIHSKGYRITHINAVRVENGMFQSVTATKKGVEQVGRLDPFSRHSGAISGISAEVSFGSILIPDTSQICEYATALKDGSWLGIYGADFREQGAKNLTIFARASRANCSMEIRLSSPEGELIGSFTMPRRSSSHISFTNYNVELSRVVTGVQDVYFVFDSGFVLGEWGFGECGIGVPSIIY